jgi:RNA 3'-terminal phosphate cyclase
MALWNVAGVGRDAAQTLLGHAPMQLTIGDHLARQVIEPVALSACHQLE